MITCIGEILIDRFINESNVIDKVGGAPLNVAVSIIRCGGQASFVGSVGNDELGDYILKKSQDYKLTNVSINKLEGYDTSIALVTLNKGERSFKFIRDNGADYHLPLPLPSFVFKSNIVHISSLMLCYEEGRNYIHKIIKILKKEGICISFDVNYRKDIFLNQKEAIEIYKDIINEIDILKISEEELILLGEDYINSLRNKLICISFSNEGSKYIYNDIEGYLSSFKVEVKDSTGAGDAFFGYILSSIDGKNLSNLKKEELDNIFLKANAVGALSVTKLGAIDSIPYKEEVDAFMKGY